jgi:hypothetical protein
MTDEMVRDMRLVHLLPHTSSHTPPQVHNTVDSAKLELSRIHEKQRLHLFVVGKNREAVNVAKAAAAAAHAMVTQAENANDRATLDDRLAIFSIGSFKKGARHVR